MIQKQITYYASNDLQYFFVPNNVTTVHVDCVASKGYRNNGGKGGRVQCDLTVTPNQTLYIAVGGIPTADIPASYNASDIRTNNTGITDITSLNSRILVAGGGGGGSSNYGGYSGGGEQALPLSRIYLANDLVSPTGGTQETGGLDGGNNGHHGDRGQRGSFGLGGNSGNYGAGSGGAGWYGGGGGGNHRGNDCGGGGGSSYTDSSRCSNVVHTQGYNNGAGYITISYEDDIRKYNQCYYGPEHVSFISVNKKIIRYVYKGNSLIYELGFDPVYYYPKSTLQTFTVPIGITKIHVDCVASKGYGNKAGKGGRVQCDLTVTSGQTLYIAVGKIPDKQNTASYNASDIRISGGEIIDSTSLDSRLIVAGGGGTGGTYSNGGDGGKTVGAESSGWGNYSTAAGGGTQSAGGIGATFIASGYNYENGKNGQFAIGGSATNNHGIAGAGGAGYYGGGGGAGMTLKNVGTKTTGGGGGSSYTNSAYCSNVVHTQGYNNGFGYVIISPVFSI